MIKVFDQASITDSAIISALMVTQAGALRTHLGDKDISKRAQIAIQYIERIDEELAHRGLAKAGLSAEETEMAADVVVKHLQDPELKGVQTSDNSLEVQVAFEFVRDLLRYYRPDFDDIPRDEQIALIGHQCSRIRSALKAIKSVVEYAEFGTPDGRLNPATKNAYRDISAARLYDIERRTYEEIAEYFGEPPRSPSSEDKHDYPTTRQRVARGRKLLKQAYGDEGWSELVEFLRHDADVFEQLPEEVKELEVTANLIAEHHGIPFDRVIADYTQYVKDIAAKLGVTFEEAARTSRDAEPGYLMDLGLINPMFHYAYQESYGSAWPTDAPISD
jgi:hypothetical protein